MRTRTTLKERCYARSVGVRPYLSCADMVRAELNRLARQVRLKRKAECNKQLKACSRCYCQAMDNVLALIEAAKR